MKSICPGRILAALCLLTGWGPLKAQQETQAGFKPQVKLGLYYHSGLNYYGRTDSLQSSGAFALAELWLTRQFYINAAPVFIHNATASLQYAGTVTTAGFQCNHRDKFAGHFYLVKPFYRESSQLVQAALKEQLSAELTWLNPVVDLTAGADLKFSDRTDLGAKAGLDHRFRFILPGNRVLALVPSAYLYTGTQQFASTYYRKTGGFLLFPGTVQPVTQESGRFAILSWEFSTSVVLATGHFQFLVSPAYVLPENLLTAAQSPGGAERGKNLLYVTAGVKYSFRK